MLYNETIVKVFATPEEWLGWLTVYGPERHDYLHKRGCSGYFVKPEEIEAPIKYPVLAMVGFNGSFSVDPVFIYPEHILKLMFPLVATAKETDKTSVGIMASIEERTI